VCCERARKSRGRPNGKPWSAAAAFIYRGVAAQYMPTCVLCVDFYTIITIYMVACLYITIVKSTGGVWGASCDPRIFLYGSRTVDFKINISCRRFTWLTSHRTPRAPIVEIDSNLRHWNSVALLMYMQYRDDNNSYYVQFST